MAAQPEAAATYMNDDVCGEILLRLPFADVLRFRTICKAWHRITTNPGSVAAHANRCPLELIVQRHGVNGALDTVPLLTLDEKRRRCLDIEYPEYRGPPEPFWRGYTLIGSCDGLLLLQRGVGSSHFVGNPLTRHYLLVCDFYLHGPSGEHRILYHTDGEQGSHYVYSLEAADTRRVGPAVPVVLFPGDVPDGKLCSYKILAFDTVSEAFGRISRPPARYRIHNMLGIFLLEVDGKLAMTDISEGSMDLWVLDDYDNDESWTRCLLRVQLPPALRRATLAMNVGAESLNVILVGDHYSTSAGLYDLKRKRFLKQFQFVTAGDLVRRTRLNALVFSPSLKRRGFFDVEEPP
ncbi:hypothetical protein BS78_K202900 [Paspalum vaginatum]|uniref:F-box domain-containing protein n=1 Tax=Paspalum vaginatum TaxID=158149 RepID=A0A9W7X744_9POAL|nr:hypothetical protein BS78_K202900 [Paspalum vaginatum]